MWYIWLIAAGIFFVAEIATTGFLIFWLGIGAIASMITSFFVDNLFIQTAVFVITSCLLIPLTKVFAKKIDKNPSTKTNAFSLIGKIGVVVIDINTIDSTGQVKVNGEVWSAKADENIPKNTTVEIVDIEGVKLIVKPRRDAKENVTI